MELQLHPVRFLVDTSVCLPKLPSNASHHSANDRAIQERQSGSRFPVSSGDTDKESPPDLWFRLLG